jgi:hypothetical protein
LIVELGELGAWLTVIVVFAIIIAAGPKVDLWLYRRKERRAYEKLKRAQRELLDDD